MEPLKSLEIAIKKARDEAEFYSERNVHSLEKVQSAIESIEVPNYEEDLQSLYHCLETLKAMVAEYLARPVEEKEDFLPELGKKIDGIGTLVSKIKAPELKGIESELKGILKAIKGIKLESEEVDLSPVTSSLSEIKKKIPKVSLEKLEKLGLTGFTSIYKCLEEVKGFNKEILELLRKIEKDRLFKLDKMQLAALQYSGGGGYAGSPPATNVTVKNLSMPTANTEYSYQFPKNTVSWKIRVRDSDVPLLYSFTTGKLPTSGDGTEYGTIFAYFLDSQSGVEWAGKTIYLQTGSASQVAEIISYQF